MAWQYPRDRYYYAWYGQTEPERAGDLSDLEIKSMIVDRLRENSHTKDDDITVHVKEGVVILAGDVSSTLAKRAAGDDAWDTPGVVDVSNQLTVRGMRAAS